MTTLWQSPIFQVLGWTIIHSLWQGALMWGAAAVLLRVLRNKSPQAGYAAACGTFGAMVLFVIGTCIYLTNQIIPNTTETSAALIESAAPAETWLAYGIPWLSVGWMLGVSTLSIRLFGGWYWLFYGIKRGAAPSPSEWQWRMTGLSRRLGIAREVRLLVSLKTCVPLVVGWIAPVVIIPASALLRLSPNALEAILTHELAHIRRHDFVVNLMQSIVEVLFFYHPAVWILSGKIRELREHCCDDAAVKHCGSPISYAGALADLETLRADSALPQLAPAANGASLMKRIQRLLSVSEPATSGIRAGLIAAAILSVVGASALWSFGGDTQQRLERQRIIIKDGKSSLNVQMRGDVKLDPNSKDGANLGDGAALEITAKENDSTRSYALSREGNDLKKTYRVDGQERPMDVDAEVWVKGQIQEIKTVEARKSKFSDKENDKIHFEITEDGKDGKDAKVIIYSNRNPMVFAGPGFDGMSFNRDRFNYFLPDFDKSENEELRKQLLEEARNKALLVAEEYRIGSEEFRKGMEELRAKSLANIEGWREKNGEEFKKQTEEWKKQAEISREYLKNIKILQQDGKFLELGEAFPEREGYVYDFYWASPDYRFRAGSPDEQKKRIENEIERLKTRMDHLREELKKVDAK